MDSFLLLPCTKPSEPSKQVLLRNGEVIYQGQGKVWRETHQHARKLVNIRDESQDVKIRDIQYCSSLNAFFYLIDTYSGVFANPVSSSMCMPLGFGRLECGLRVAQPVRTFGPRTTCMDISNDKVCAGDAWGAVAIWSLDDNISAPPLWTFGAHDGTGCSSVALVDDYNLIVTTGEIREQIKVWSLEEDGEVRLLGCHTLKDGESFSSNPIVLISNEKESFDQPKSIVVLVGVNNGHLLFWRVSLSQMHDRDEDGDQYVKMTSSKENAVISKLNVFEDKLIIASFDSGKVVLLDAKSIVNHDNIRMIVIKQFAKPPLGVFEDMIVFDSSTSIPLTTILNDFSKHKNELLQDEDDIDDLNLEEGRDKRVPSDAKVKSAHDHHYNRNFGVTRTTRIARTKPSLNRPLHDTTTFGQDLIPIDPDKPRNGRRCCKVPPPSSVPEQIWVKRKVKPPPINPSKRRPLYENPLWRSTSNNNMGNPQQPQQPVRLPPFCKSTSNRPSWALPEFYLTEKDGNIVTSTAVGK